MKFVVERTRCFKGRPCPGAESARLVVREWTYLNVASVEEAREKYPYAFGSRCRGHRLEVGDRGTVLRWERCRAGWTIDVPDLAAAMALAPEDAEGVIVSRGTNTFLDGEESGPLPHLEIYDGYRE